MNTEQQAILASTIKLAIGQYFDSIDCPYVYMHSLPALLAQIHKSANTGAPSDARESLRQAAEILSQMAAITLPSDE